MINLIWFEFSGIQIEISRHHTQNERQMWWIIISAFNWYSTEICSRRGLWNTCAKTLCSNYIAIFCISNHYIPYLWLRLQMAFCLILQPRLIHVVWRKCYFIIYYSIDSVSLVTSWRISVLEGKDEKLPCAKYCPNFFSLGNGSAECPRMRLNFGLKWIVSQNTISLKFHAIWIKFHD